MHRLHTVAHVAPGSTIVEGVAIALPPEFPHGAVPPCVLSPDYPARFGLDRLRDVNLPIRLLTGKNPQSIEDGFPAALATFDAEGRQIEVRRHAKLHDRHFIFIDGCWLL